MRFDEGAESVGAGEREDDSVDLSDRHTASTAARSARAPSSDAPELDRLSDEEENLNPEKHVFSTRPPSAAEQKKKAAARAALLREELEYQKETHDKVQTNMFGYSDGSSSDDNQIDSSSAGAKQGLTVPDAAPADHCNDLEELD